MPYKDKKKRLAARKRYLAKHPGKDAKYQRTMKEKDPRISLLNSARERARRFNLPINLTREDIVIPEFCPIFPNLILERMSGFGRDNSPTLDRVIPRLGYIKGNVEVISFKANRLKSNATADELFAVAAYLKRKEYP